MAELLTKPEGKILGQGKMLGHVGTRREQNQDRLAENGDGLDGFAER